MGISTNFELFVFDKANEASKNFMDNLMKTAGDPVEKKISYEEIRQWKDVECLIDFLELPKHPPRKIDEEYTPPPRRYIVVSPELGSFLKTKEQTKDQSVDVETEEVSFFYEKIKGSFQYYQIFIGRVFKTEDVLVIQDLTNGEAKAIGYFKLKGIFDF